MSDIENAARELVKARRERHEAKMALAKYRKRNGSCEEDVPTYPDGGHTGPCYRRYPALPLEKWCEVCQGAEPLYQARKHSAARVGPALRRLTYLCNKEAP